MAARRSRHFRSELTDCNAIPTAIVPRSSAPEKVLADADHREKLGVGGIGLRSFPTKRNFQLYVAHSKASIGFGQAGDSNGGCPMAPFR
jgi:hypothetical protein